MLGSHAEMKRDLDNLKAVTELCMIAILLW